MFDVRYYTFKQTKEAYYLFFVNIITQKNCVSFENVFIDKTPIITITDYIMSKSTTRNITFF